MSGIRLWWTVGRRWADPLSANLCQLLSTFVLLTGVTVLRGVGGAMLAHWPIISQLLSTIRESDQTKPCQRLINWSPPLASFCYFCELLSSKTYVSGIRWQWTVARGGGRCHDGIIDGPPAHYQEIKSKCKRCTILLGSGGVGNWQWPKEHVWGSPMGLGWKTVGDSAGGERLIKADGRSVSPAVAINLRNCSH